MSVLHPGLFFAIERFPEHRDAFRHLYSTDESFQSLCDNLQQCSDALRYWAESKDKKASERHREYLTLLQELELEIVDYC